MLMNLWQKSKSFINTLCGIGCLIIVSAISFQIFCRTFLGFSTSWSEEVAEICFVGMIFLYLAQCEEEEAHLRLDILFQIWPGLKFYMDVIGKIAAIIYCCFVLYSEYLLIPPTNKLTTAACHLHIRYVHYLIVVGSLFWIIQLIINIINTIQKHRKEDQL